MAKKDELNFETDNKMASSEKLKALQAAMEKIEKSFGKGSSCKWLPIPCPQRSSTTPYPN